MKSNLEVLCKPHKPRYVNVEKGLSKNSPAFQFHRFLAEIGCVLFSTTFFYHEMKSSNPGLQKYLLELKVFFLR